MDKTDVDKLIQLVQNRPVLYDELHDDYPDYEKRLQAWHEISELLNQPVDKCQKKWRGLRSLFNAFIRQKEKNSNANWTYAEQLTFLTKYLRRNRKSMPFVVEPEQEMNNEIVEDKNFDDEEVLMYTKSTDDNKNKDNSQSSVNYRRSKYTYLSLNNDEPNTKDIINYELYLDKTNDLNQYEEKLIFFTMEDFKVFTLLLSLVVAFVLLIIFWPLFLRFIKK